MDDSLNAEKEHVPLYEIIAFFSVSNYNRKCKDKSKINDNSWNSPDFRNIATFVFWCV